MSDSSPRDTVGRPSPKRGRPPTTARRDQIVETALQLVAERGVDSTTIARIATAVGVTEGALYKHFESREDILKAVCDAQEEGGKRRVRSHVNPNALERLREIFGPHTDPLEDQPVWAMFLVFAFIVSNPDLGLREYSREVARRLVGQIADIVEEGKAQGAIRADVDADLIAWQFARIQWGQDVSSLLGLEPTANADISAMALKWILADIASPEPERRAPDKS